MSPYFQATWSPYFSYKEFRYRLRQSSFSKERRDVHPLIQARGVFYVQEETSTTWVLSSLAQAMEVIQIFYPQKSISLASLCSFETAHNPPLQFNRMPLQDLWRCTPTTTSTWCSHWPKQGNAFIPFHLFLNFNGPWICFFWDEWNPKTVVVSPKLNETPPAVNFVIFAVLPTTWVLFVMLTPLLYHKHAHPYTGWCVSVKTDGLAATLGGPRLFEDSNGGGLTPKQSGSKVKYQNNVKIR
jgi:hypothetical protein